MSLWKIEMTNGKTEYAKIYIYQLIWLYFIASRFEISNEWNVENNVQEYERGEGRTLTDNMMVKQIAIETESQIFWMLEKT